MNFEDCIRFLQENPNGFLATAEGEKPHVRPMTVWLADKSGIYLYTSAVKPLASQLSANLNVEMAFYRRALARTISARSSALRAELNL